MTPEVFAELSQLDPKKPETFMSYGKLCSFHVTFRNYGEDYPFAGKDHPGEELKHPYLQRLLAWCKEQSGCNMNQLLLNFYADESKHLGWHSDNDAFQPGFPPVYSFSFGAERTFEVARKVPSPTRKDLLRSFTMKDNTLLIMGGACQLQCKHRVPPPRHGVRKGMRLNVTVRAIVPETPAQKARKASAKLTREVRKAKKEAQEAEDSLRKDPLFAVLEKLDSSPT
jgi:alkylated DNA repair dioxygenase AlkB